jgi:hypothetical protein
MSKTKIITSTKESNCELIMLIIINCEHFHKIRGSNCEHFQIMTMESKPIRRAIIDTEFITIINAK